MAEGIVIEGKSLEELEREITCAICQEHYTEPKILPCLHYYCKQCVLRLALRKATGQPFSCPECRSRAILPEGGVDELKTAFYINRLKTIVTSMKQAQGKDKPHHKPCPKHKEPLIIYCFNCDSVICPHCIVKDHRNHDFEFCKTAAPTIKEELLEKLVPLKEGKENLAQAMHSIQTSRKELEAHGDNITISIQKSFKELREILDEREQELLQEAAGTVARKMEKLSEQEEKLSVASAEVQSVVDYTEQCVRDCTDNEVMSMHTEIRRRIEQKIEEHSKSERSLKPVEEVDIGVEVRCTGALQQLCQTQANIIQYPFDLAKCTVTMADDANHEVNKITNAILVTKLSNNKISRRHYEMFCSLRSLYNNVTTKCKVAATGAGQYSIEYTPIVRGHHKLTVSVDGQQVAGSPFPVFVSIHPTQLGKPVKVWTNIACPTGITVNSIGEILVSEYSGNIIKFDRKGNRTMLVKQNKIASRKLEVSNESIYCMDEHKRIFRCDMDGRSIITHELHQVKEGKRGLVVIGEEVMMSIKDTRGTVLVYDKELNYVRCMKHEDKGYFWGISADCHGNLYCVDYETAMICVFSSDGVLLHLFGCDEKGEKKVKEPWGLCVSGHYVYVCNSGFHNISVFTTDGAYVTSFGQHGSNEGDFRLPYSVCVDRDGFVYVSDNVNNRVQIF